MIAGRTRSSAQPANVEETPGLSARVLTQILERSARVQGPAIDAYVQRLRRTHPDASPADIIAKLEKHYLAAVMASGAAVGSAAAFPGIGTLTAMSAVAGETVVFLEATAVFALALADVHAIPIDHRERRRTLVLSVLVGDESRHAVKDLLGRRRVGGAWLSDVAEELPLPMLSQLNNRLLKYFAKRYALRRSTLVLGKMLPAGVGAVVGGVGNRVMGKKIIANARNAFGPPPNRWPVNLLMLPSPSSVD
ncbi:MAG: hypothetical protein JO152_02200 [Mycobacteriaceae bacterium]|nr:hypothetical protein [Mycobacteriaceae bacterium]